MRATAHDIGEERTLTIIEFQYSPTIYIVEDNNGIEGSSRKNEKQAIYNYNRNKKRKEKECWK
nr:MAG TPA: hypothetical protein [Caudoviricetes sp.]